jgi:hypothetical protein
MPAPDPQDFRKETDEWMKTLGYSCHSSGLGGRTLVYTPISPEIGRHMPTIIVQEHNNRYCELVGGGDMRLGLQIKSGHIQYKHPDIQRWIDTMTYYSRICSINPPF